jgi:hypothetical protein
LRRSKTVRTETSFGPDFITSFIPEIYDVDEITAYLIHAYMLEEDPKTYDEAIKSIDSNF